MDSSRLVRFPSNRIFPVETSQFSILNSSTTIITVINENLTKRINVTEVNGIEEKSSEQNKTIERRSPIQFVSKKPENDPIPNSEQLVPSLMIEDTDDEKQKVFLSKPGKNKIAIINLIFQIQFHQFHPH